MENEDYNPVEPIYYNYKGINCLTSELPGELFSYDYIYACPYNINKDGKFPFLKFLLINSYINKNLNFPIVPVFKNFNNDELINFSKLFLFGLLMLNEYEEFNNNIIFNGFYEYNNNLYLFFDISHCSSILINDIYSNNNLWFALIDEMLNKKKLCNMNIEEDVTNFFSLNENFCFLNDENNNSYEIPIVGYVRKPENKVNFTYIFGETKSDKNSILGPYYYFTDYVSLFKNIDNDNKQGIVRFALFVGVTKYIQNYPNDKIDESEIKKQRLCDEKLDQNIERLTMRISDHDGKWAEKYDSAYLGNIELDNGKILEKQKIVLKEYNQQIPLSYHYIRNKNLNEKIEDYLIL